MIAFLYSSLKYIQLNFEGYMMFEARRTEFEGLESQIITSDFE